MDESKNRSVKYWVVAALAGLAFDAAFAADPAPPVGTSAPVIHVLGNQRMLTLTVPGDQAQVADSAVRLLLAQFFAGATEAEKNAPVTPRVRWSARSGGGRGKIRIGTYGLPVSDAFPAPRDRRFRLGVWHYGLTAETLHAGPYAAEAATAESLRAALERSGYAIQGGLEEEYVEGRGTLYQGDERFYKTLLRYPVAPPAKAAEPAGAALPLTSLP